MKFYKWCLKWDSESKASQRMRMQIFWGSCYSTDSNLKGLGRGPQLYGSNQLPGDTQDAAPQTSVY